MSKFHRRLIRDVLLPVELSVIFAGFNENEAHPLNILEKDHR